MTRAISLDDGFVPSFDEEWPELARRLDRFLAANGVDQWSRSDVLQETAARLYPRWPELDHSQPLWNLVVTVALRIVHDHRRKDARIDLVAEPTPLHGDDVDVRGLQRAQLGKARSAMRRLTPDQRRVLLAEVGEASLPAGTRNRVNVLRLRARARLREALGPWAPAAIALRTSSLRTAVERRGSEWGQHAAVLTTSLAHLAVAATLFLSGAGTDRAAAMPHQLFGKDPKILGLRESRHAGDRPTTANVFRPERPKPAAAAQDPSPDQAGEAPGPVTDPLKPARQEWRQARGTYNETRRRTFDTIQKEYNGGRRTAVKTAQRSWREARDLVP